MMKVTICIMKMITMMNKFYLSKSDSYICGVCGGLSDLTGIDSTIFRILFVIMFFCTGSMIGILYLLIWCLGYLNQNDK
jgi:phage shock protein PspC (stress-responsive transcriptional regulator)